MVIVTETMRTKLEYPKHCGGSLSFTYVLKAKDTMLKTLCRII